PCVTRAKTIPLNPLEGRGGKDVRRLRRAALLPLPWGNRGRAEELGAGGAVPAAVSPGAVLGVEAPHRPWDPVRKGLRRRRSRAGRGRGPPGHPRSWKRVVPPRPGVLRVYSARFSVPTTTLSPPRLSAGAWVCGAGADGGAKNVYFSKEPHYVGR
ncbi:hypothetical protein MC885_008721, partial [Smutsia gigantea]